MSLRALRGSIPSVLERAYEPGAWHVDGFKSTPDYPPEVKARIAAEQNFEEKAYRPETLANLRDALAALNGRETRVYLSPMNAFELRLASAAGRDRDIAQWRRDIAALVRSTGAAFADFTDDHPFAEFDPRAGSSDAWLDPSTSSGRWGHGS
jgi:hypothetical protein